jgi:hypothetical protein
LSVKVISASNKESNIVDSIPWTFWEPSCLGSNLSQWLDATETTTLTVVSSLVTNWRDKSSNARNLVQTTQSRQSTYSASALGAGLPGLNFSSSGYYIGPAAFAYAQATGASFMAVIQGNKPSVLRYLFSEGRTSGPNYYAPLVNSTTNFLTAQIGNDANLTDVNLPTTSSVMFDTAKTLHFIMTTDSTTELMTYSNGTAQTELPITYARTASTINYYCLGSLWKNATKNSGFVGNLGEFIITNGVLSAADRVKLEGYVAHKWSAAATLPVGHAHISLPP